jgi:hypothetical protein
VTLCSGGHVDIAETCSVIVPGTRCFDSMGGVECRAPVPDPMCEDLTTHEWCSDTSAWTCSSGVRAEVKCGALPGGTCVEKPYGDGGTIAHCLSTDPDFVVESQ